MATTNPRDAHKRFFADRPADDDPRIEALARARQQVAADGSFLPTWDELTEDERQGSLSSARNYLHAAIVAGLTGKEG